MRAPILCYVTDRKSLSMDQPETESERDRGQALLSRINAARTAGVDWIQLREKDLSGKDYSLLARSILQQSNAELNTSNPSTPDARAAGHNYDRDSTRTSIRILINDRLDVAIAEQAGGLHLGEKSLPIKEVRNWLRAQPQASQFTEQKFLIGVSCHSRAAAQSAAQDGADYIFFGPVFTTPSKITFGAPQGLEHLAEICASVAIPVLAIGGITRDNAASCIAAGAAGIAAIRLFQDATDLRSLVNQLRTALT